MQISWDESEILPNIKAVSPWQVEFVSPTPPIPAGFSPAKKFKGMENPGLLTDGKGDPPLPSVGFSPMMGQLHPSFLNYNTFPDGMQGARQKTIFSSSLPNVMNDGTQVGYHDDHMNSSSQKVEAVSTDLNIGSSSPETHSHDSQTSVEYTGTSPDTEHRSRLTRKVAKSFVLFGKVIYMNPLENGNDDTKCTEYVNYTTAGTRDSLNISLPDPNQ